MLNAIKRGIRCAFRPEPPRHIVRPFHWIHRTLYKNEHGFGLIEISIILIMFSVFFARGFSLWQAHARTRKHETTLRHQQLIFKALAHYLQQNGCLPYPGRIDHARHKKDGWGTSNGNEGNGTKPGIVPYRTLFLPARVAKDGFGHWMTYAVDVNMTQKKQCCKSEICKRVFSTRSTLDIIENDHSAKKDLEENEQKYHPPTNREGNKTRDQRFEGLAVVLVSHGHHGWGAPRSTGQRVPFPPSTSTRAQLNGDDSMVFSSCDPSESYEHGIVQGKTRTSIMDDAYLGCSDYFYYEDAKKNFDQNPTVRSGFQNTSNTGFSQNNTKDRAGFTNASFLQQKSSIKPSETF